MQPIAHRGTSLPLTLILAASGMMTLAACGSGERGPRRDQGATFYEAGVGGRGVLLRPGEDLNAAYSAAIDLKTKGDCAGASMRLRPIASLGPGYENAQTALGECLIQTGAASELSANYLEGLAWLRRAGDAGWPEAQGKLAQTHAFGPAAIRSGDEAAYWLALYDANTGKSRIGFLPLKPTVLDSIRSTITPAETAGGKKRAAQWQRQVWIPPTPAGAPNIDARGTQGPQVSGPFQ